MENIGNNDFFDKLNEMDYVVVYDQEKDKYFYLEFKNEDLIDMENLLICPICGRKLTEFYNLSLDSTDYYCEYCDVSNINLPLDSTDD